MNDLDLLEEVVEELEAIEQEQINDTEEFRERYDLLIDCAVDELNDEILKLKLGDVKTTGRLVLMKDGAHAVYRRDVISSHVFIGGEEFKLKSVERGMNKSGSLINFIFEPLQPSAYSYMVLAYDRALEYMDANFSKMIATTLLPAMDSINQDVVKLQHEFADRDRRRAIRASGGNAEAYDEENTW